jgi:NADH-quinone oxidoreductase subunit E
MSIPGDQGARLAGGAEVAGPGRAPGSEDGAGGGAGRSGAVSAPADGELLRRYPVPRSALLPLLWRAQERDGYVTDEARDEIAALLKLPPAEVDSVISFYTMFRRRPPAERRLQVCRSLACAALGADELIAELRAKREGRGAAAGQADGCAEIEAVECLAACDRAPCGLFNERVVGPLDREKAEALLRCR